ncbi:Uncharacterised protein [Sphingomonas paucimobilis]|nr:Uncharacterised protein [Sphingomonas paucimobilis]
MRLDDYDNDIDVGEARGGGGFGGGGGGLLFGLLPLIGSRFGCGGSSSSSSSWRYWA